MRTFRKGSAVFKCRVCGRGTRETGVQSTGIGTCPQCFDLAGIENEISDGACTREDRLSEIADYVAEIKAKGGNVADWVSTFNLTEAAR